MNACVSAATVSILRRVSAMRTQTNNHIEERGRQAERREYPGWGLLYTMKKEHMSYQKEKP
jgi:hypothetical protein